MAQLNLYQTLGLSEVLSLYLHRLRPVLSSGLQNWALGLVLCMMEPILIL